MIYDNWDHLRMYPPVSGSLFVDRIRDVFQVPVAWTKATTPILIRMGEVTRITPASPLAIWPRWPLRLSILRPVGELDAPVPDLVHPEDYCHECGRPNIVWFADNSVWNAVMGDGSGILCPVCFVLRAELRGCKTTGWKLVPQDWVPRR